MGSFRMLMLEYDRQRALRTGLGAEILETNHSSALSAPELLAENRRVPRRLDQHAAVRPNWLAEQSKPIKYLKAFC